MAGERRTDRRRRWLVKEPGTGGQREGDNGSDGWKDDDFDQERGLGELGAKDKKGILD